MKRVLVCLGFAVALGIGAVGCTGTGWRVGIYGEYEVCLRCGYRHAPGMCPGDNWWNRPQYCPPHCDPPCHEERHGHHGRGCR